MRRLVTIDLSGADLAVFEAYEDAVLALLPKYGARLEMQVRSLDGATETHLLFFPDAAAYEAFRSDPVRLAKQEGWRASGAVSVGIEVEERR